MAENKKYSIIKGKFQSQMKKIYGIFFFIMNRELNSVDTASVIVSLYSHVYDININDPIFEFDSKIRQIKSEGQYALSATNSLQSSLKNISQDYTFYREIDPYLTSMDNERLEPILKSFFSRVLEDKRIEMQVKIQEADEDDISLPPSPEDEFMDEELDSDWEDRYAGKLDHPPTPSRTILEVNLILAPVGGKLVTELEVGDQIMVRVRPNIGNSDHYIDLYNLRSDGGHILPVVSKIISFNKGEGKCEIIVQITEDVLGRVWEEEKVLVKLAPVNQATQPRQIAEMPELHEPPAKNKITPSQKETRSSIMLLVGIGFIAIILTLILILLITGA